MCHIWDVVFSVFDPEKRFDVGNACGFFVRLSSFSLHLFYGLSSTSYKNASSNLLSIDMIYVGIILYIIKNLS